MINIEIEGDLYMNYITYDEMPSLEVPETIAKIKREIETNLFHVHNKFAKNKFESAGDIYDSLMYGFVDEADEKIMEPVIKVYETFIGLLYCHETETEEVLAKYKELEGELKEIITGLT